MNSQGGTHTYPGMSVCMCFILLKRVFVGVFVCISIHIHTHIYSVYQTNVFMKAGPQKKLSYILFAVS